MEDAIRERDVESLRAFFETRKAAGYDEEYLLSRCDRLTRERGLALVDDREDDVLAQTDALREHLNFVHEVAKIGFCLKTTPVNLLSDVFETHLVGTCEKLFTLVEENLAIWKQPPFVDSCQSNVLRMCNDLVKRVSRSIWTSFCGRILSFLSRYLPLTEKSGLNHMGHFNTENITNYEQFTEKSIDGSTANCDEDMEVGEIVESKESSIPADQVLYTKFWSLQAFFSIPNTCYNRNKWTEFQKNCSEVLNVFASYKLEKPRDEDDDSNRRRRREEERLKMEERIKDEADSAARSAMKVISDDSEGYFAKYLTSPKLLHLQLNDSQFRRCFLMQCLVLFQYLVSDVRTKQKTMVLSEEQLRFVVECQDKCYKLLRETHPKGSHFAEILQREEKWGVWKNAQCPDYTQLASKDPLQNWRKRERSKYDPSKVDLGSVELTKLWSIEPDMMAACKDPKRRFTPALSEYLRDPVDEMDPEQQVEEQYKSIHDAGFQWRTSRLLLAEGPNYLSATSTPLVGPTLPFKKFLEDQIVLTAKKLPGLREELAEREEKAAKKKAHESMLRARSANDGNMASPAGDAELGEERIKALVPLLQKDWRALAAAMEVSADDMRVLERNEHNRTDTQITDMLLRGFLEEHGSTVRTVRNVCLNASLLTEEVIDVLRANA